MEIIIILILILLNGIFSMTEMSLISSRKFKLLAASKKGSTGATTALKLAENPTKFLSTIQIGITLIGILLGIFSGEKLTKNLESLLLKIELLKPYAHSLAVTIIVIFITFISILLGELLPKRLGLSFPERIAVLFAKPMMLLSVITSPFVWLLTVANNLILKLFGFKNITNTIITEEEIKSIVKESAAGGEIQNIEYDIVKRVFELGDRKVTSLMTQLKDIVFFNEEDDVETVRAKINNNKHSAYPVFKNSDTNNVIGVVLVKDLFAATLQNRFDLSLCIKTPVFIDTNMYVYKLLELFKKEKMHYAIVSDEYGSVKGMVTLSDLLEELVGHVTKINEKHPIIQRNQNSWVVNGQYSKVDFLKYFDIEIENNYKKKSLTIAGLFIDYFKAIPNVGDKIFIKDFEMEIIDKDGQRIDKILVTKK